jgi:orotidine-5'-phosphate decarboxylase
MMSARSPIAVALDVPQLSAAVAIARDVSAEVGYVKVGLESYLRDGKSGLNEVMAAATPGTGLFLDLKLHDIPNTVAGAARSVADLTPEILTVHAAGGPEMIAAAVHALPHARIAAVTILTSLSAQNLIQIGLLGSPIEAVCRLARLAVDAGASALVCSPLEVADVRAAVGPDVLLITPGVRPVEGDVADQQRVATPAAAIAAGADLLVIGRPITAAADPRAAARAIAASIPTSS